jgi:tetratricopeptide (TPR) repeat protein
MKKILILSYLILFNILFFSISINSQSKEYDKLKDLVDKGKLEKAQEYCDKVTAAMEPKATARFYALMGLGYFNKKDYPKAAENLLKSSDKKISARVAKEFENPQNDFYDLKIAGKLYKIAEEYQKAAELLFQQGEYDEAALICPSPESNLKFGKKLMEQEKYDEATHFFKRAKKKGQKFSDEAVLDYYYKKKDYKTVNAIQNFGEGSYYLPIQGTVIDKMFENNEPMPFITHFLDSLNVKGTKQLEAIINSMVNNKMYAKVETYCLNQKGSDQQVAFAFLADNAASKNVGLSAWANLKSGKSLIGNQQITNYLVETAKDYNSKWEQEPIDKKLIEDFKKETNPIILKCGINYCDCSGLASTMARTKSQDLSKTNSSLSAEYLRAFTFLKEVEKNCK